MALERRSRWVRYRGKQGTQLTYVTCFERPAVIAVDTSALVAIVFAEPERDAFLQAIQTAGKALVSTATVVETRMVVHGRRGQRAVILMDDVLRLPMFELVAPGVAEMDAVYAASSPSAKEAAIRQD